MLPSVRLGIDPEKLGSYHKLIMDGVTVYYIDSVPANFQTVKIKLTKLLFFKKLVAVTG